MPVSKDAAYGSQSTDLTAVIQMLADSIDAAIQSRVNPGGSGLTQEEQRGVDFAGAALSIINASLDLGPSPVTVTEVSLSEGTEGTEVTIHGTNFTPTTPVYFGANQATGATVVSAREIRAIAPPGKSTVLVTVGGSDSKQAARFSYPRMQKATQAQSQTQATAT